MNDKTRRILLGIDYQIYLFKWRLTRRYCEFKLKFVKDKDKQNKLTIKWIYHPFSSRFESPMPSIVEKLANIYEKENITT